MFRCCQWQPSVIDAKIFRCLMNTCCHDVLTMLKKHHEKPGFHYPNLDVFFQRTPAIQGTPTGFWVSLQKLQQSQQSFGNSRAFNSAFMEFLPGSTFQLADERTLAMPDVAPLGCSGSRATRCTRSTSRMFLSLKVTLWLFNVAIENDH